MTYMKFKIQKIHEKNIAAVEQAAIDGKITEDQKNQENQGDREPRGQAVITSL